jgi:predicted nucleotidyltransferase
VPSGHPEGLCDVKAEAVSAARSFIDTHYPDAEIAFLGGSVITSVATATSDLDILVLLGADKDDVSYVETTTHQG